jgi:hypothetical protein
MFVVCKKEEIVDTSLGNKFVGDLLCEANDAAEFLLELLGKDIILDRGMCKGN